MRFHYLRVGKTVKLLDDLRQKSAATGIEWVQYESQTFARYHFGKNYSDFDGAVVNLAVDDENITAVRRDFWENFVWKTADSPLVFALVIPSSTQYGSLTKSQVMEALSLIRLTDRAFEIFENSEDIAEKIVSWLTGMTAIVHRREREIIETNSS